MVGFGLVLVFNCPHLILFQSLTDFCFTFPHCSPVDSLLKLDNTETQVELQDVDPGAGDKNENVKDKNQQNYQGRAFIWYRILKNKEILKLQFLLSCAKLQIASGNHLPCCYLWILNLVFLAAVD